MTQFNTYDLKEIIEKKGSVLAFDLGIKKIGVAVGNNVLKTSRNLITFYSKNKNQRIEKIKQLVNEWQPVYLVLGLPLNQDFSANDTTKFCINTAKDIEKNINLPIFFVNENYSSTSAEEFIKDLGNKKQKNNNALVDQVAANIILQSHFNEVEKQMRSLDA
ncbi:MAG: Holliday junction resolvase RuvX [Betaproteobacteria bacterium]|nr:Holliday junction resolvase RuvX [Betaproteobacteria bacterium]